MRLVFSIIILAGAVGIFFVFARPELDKISALRAQEAEVNQSLAELQELAKLRDNLLTQYNSVSPVDIERLDKIVPSNIDSGLFLAELETFARDYGVILNSISITDERQQAATRTQSAAVGRDTSSQAFQKLPITLSISGTYVSLRDFLKRLEMNTRIVDISSINFNSNEKDFFEFRINANTYWTGVVPSSAKAAN